MYGRGYAQQHQGGGGMYGYGGSGSHGGGGGGAGMMMGQGGRNHGHNHSHSHGHHSHGGHNHHSNHGNHSHGGHNHHSNHGNHNNGSSSGGGGGGCPHCAAKAAAASRGGGQNQNQNMMGSMHMPSTPGAWGSYDANRQQQQQQHHHHQQHQQQQQQWQQPSGYRGHQQPQNQYHRGGQAQHQMRQHAQNRGMRGGNGMNNEYVTIDPSSGKMHPANMGGGGGFYNQQNQHQQQQQQQHHQHMHQHQNHQQQSQMHAGNMRRNGMYPPSQPRDEKSPVGLAHSTIYKAAAMAPHPASQMNHSGRGGMMRPNEFWTPDAVLGQLERLGLAAEAFKSNEQDFFEGYGEGERWGETVNTNSRQFYERVGNAAWKVLHQTAASYPEEPTPGEQRAMYDFMVGLSKVYPCSNCAEHLAETIRRHPPAVGSRREISLWMCRAHNAVNARLGKPVFHCNMQSLDKQYSTPAASAVASARMRSGAASSSSARSGVASAAPQQHHKNMMMMKKNGNSEAVRPLQKVKMGSTVASNDKKEEGGSGFLAYKNSIAAAAAAAAMATTTNSAKPEEAEDFYKARSDNQAPLAEDAATAIPAKIATANGSTSTELPSSFGASFGASLAASMRDIPRKTPDRIAVEETKRSSSGSKMAAEKAAAYKQMTAAMKAKIDKEKEAAEKEKIEIANKTMAEMVKIQNMAEIKKQRELMRKSAIYNVYRAAKRERDLKLHNVYERVNKMYVIPDDKETDEEAKERVRKADACNEIYNQMHRHQTEWNDKAVSEMNRITEIEWEKVYSKRDVAEVEAEVKKNLSEMTTDFWENADLDADPESLDEHEQKNCLLKKMVDHDDATKTLLKSE